MDDHLSISPGQEIVSNQEATLVFTIVHIYVDMNMNVYIYIYIIGTTSHGH